MKASLGVLSLSLGLITLSGCGGGGGGGSTGGGGNTDKFATPKVAITWGPRSRAISGPSSALSALIVLKHASAAGEDVSYYVERSGPPSGSTVVYPGFDLVKVGPTEMNVTFFALSNGDGDTVGTAAGPVQIGSDGTISTSVTTKGTVVSFDVTANQTIVVGEHRVLGFSAVDANGDLVAVTPESVLWDVVSGGENLSIIEGIAYGLGPGNAQVAASLDGKSSPIRTVAVTNQGEVTVSVSPSTVTLAPSGTQQFTADVQGSNNSSVVWSVVDFGGGSITQDGLYTAPAEPGTYHIKVASQANPQAAAIATVRVEIGG